MDPVGSALVQHLAGQGDNERSLVRHVTITGPSPELYVACTDSLFADEAPRQLQGLTARY